MNALPTSVVAVLGPPASGKTTVADALADAHGAAVFRVREAAHRMARTEPIIAAAVEATADPLGWLPDLLAHDLARTALDAAVGRLVVLEGYPGNRVQAQALALLLRARCRRLSVIELTARPGTLAARLARRRVCAVCDPAPGGPRRQAATDASRPGRCGACGAQLSVRDTDRGEKAELRQARYTANLPGVRAAFAHETEMAWHRLTTDPGSPNAAACVLTLLPTPPRERTPS
ncbi:nucleoside monophosphate kinase [Streptomyces noboritoensis]|uniref:Adenylate kinase n=1 Tax=Streptomyces noboritoensis TaxID=67337 RepID=A0ABV6THR4_9ACTN